VEHIGGKDLGNTNFYVEPQCHHVTLTFTALALRHPGIILDSKVNLGVEPLVELQPRRLNNVGFKRKEIEMSPGDRKESPELTKRLFIGCMMHQLEAVPAKLGMSRTGAGACARSEPPREWGIEAHLVP
jgi:hypothetical protein